MVVAGAPVPSRVHALKMSDMALDMLEAVQTVANPATDNDHVQIKIGELSSLTGHVIDKHQSDIYHLL